MHIILFNCHDYGVCTKMYLGGRRVGHLLHGIQRSVLGKYPISMDFTSTSEIAAAY
jgi:hypothetical protein